MQITMQSIGQPTADFSVSGATVTISGTAIDCAANQADTQTVLHIVKTSTGAIAINPKKGGYGLAIITIPAKVYLDKPALDDAGEPTTTRELQPLDPNTIAVEIWPTL